MAPVTMLKEAVGCDFKAATGWLMLPISTNRASSAGPEEGSLAHLHPESLSLRILHRMIHLGLQHRIDALLLQFFIFFGRHLVHGMVRRTFGRVMLRFRGSRSLRHVAPLYGWVWAARGFAVGEGFVGCVFVGDGLGFSSLVGSGEGLALNLLNISLSYAALKTDL